MSTVVIVDEEPTLLEVLGMVLESAGHEVRRTTTRDGALRLCAHATPDVIICSELSLIWAVRAVPALAGVRFVLVADPDHRITPLDAAVNVIAKPLILAELLRLVRPA